MTFFLEATPILGETALDWLSQGQRGKVLAAVNQAIYLLTEQGNLVWLSELESPKHRRCMQWPAPLPRLPIDSTFTFTEQAITFETGMNLDFSSSRTWVQSPLPPRLIMDSKLLSDRLVTFYETFLVGKIPIGCGAFIPRILQIVKNEISMSCFQLDNIIDQASWPIIEKITRACLARDLAAVLQNAEALIGLGEGLTPSGDDFLGGLFFARHLLSCSYPHLSYLEIPDLPKWVDEHHLCTNLISFVFLKDNAAGHALDPLYRFGIALLTNQSLACSTAAASELIKVGHSTGWSLLTGFLVGMSLIFTD